MIEKQEGRIILQVQPALQPLLQTLSGVDQIIARGEAIPVFDVHCPLLSLPRAFRTTLETIPQTGPYVEADRGLVGKWMERVAGDGGWLRVGIAWAGNPKHTGDRYRSIPLAQLAVLFGLEGVRFYSLQKTMEGRAEAGAGHARLLDYTSEWEDFAETAAFVSTLDLVISVDTAVAHLAGRWGSRPGRCFLLRRIGDGCWIDAIRRGIRRCGCFGRSGWGIGKALSPM